MDGWYVGPSPAHYRCYKVHINKNNIIRVEDAVELFTSKVPMPLTAYRGIVTLAVREITHILLQPAPSASFINIGDNQIQAQCHLSDIFSVSLRSHARRRSQQPVAHPPPVPRHLDKDPIGLLPPMPPWPHGPTMVGHICTSDVVPHAVQPPRVVSTGGYYLQHPPHLCNSSAPSTMASVTGVLIPAPNPQHRHWIASKNTRTPDHARPVMTMGPTKMILIDVVKFTYLIFI
jgi:hypothetical protein